MSLSRLVLVSCSLIGMLCNTAYAQYRLVDINPASQWQQPLEMVPLQGAEEQYLVVSQPGVVYLYNRNTAEQSVFMDIREQVRAGGEMGLLGLALHPAFTENRYLYVYYTRQREGLESCLSRFQVGSGQPLQVMHNSEQVLLTIPQPQTNHNGGKVAFGPDGYLYIASGDGGGAGDPGNNAQNLANLLGKILRINVDAAQGGLAYSIPADNPFVNTTNARPEIYAYGLRNPWKFSFDRETGALWAADVGQSAREEVNIIQKGGNYGWRILEGTFCYTPAENCAQTGLIPPVWEYQHGLPATGRSITGGFVYRGGLMPELHGHYIFGDFVSGRIWALNTMQAAATAELLIDSPHQIASFAEGEDGELFVLAYSGGRVYQLSPLATSLVPELQAGSLIKVYPNPSKGKFLVEFNQSFSNHSKVMLYDVHGREITVGFSEPVQQKRGLYIIESNLNLPQGIYFLRVADVDKVYNAKIIIE